MQPCLQAQLSRTITPRRNKPACNFDALPPVNGQRSCTGVVFCRCRTGSAPRVVAKGSRKGNLSISLKVDVIGRDTKSAVSRDLNNALFTDAWMYFPWTADRSTVMGSPL